MGRHCRPSVGAGGNRQTERLGGTQLTGLPRSERQGDTQLAGLLAPDGMGEAFEGVEIVMVNEGSGIEESDVAEDKEIDPGDYIIDHRDMLMVSPRDYRKYSREENEEMRVAKERWESSNS